MAPPNNPILRAALERYVTRGLEQETTELLQLFGDKKCTVLLPVRIPDKSGTQPPEMPTYLDPVLGPLVYVNTMRGEVPKYNGAYTVLICTVRDLMGDLLQGADVGVVFDPDSAHAVYFRFNRPQWEVRILERMRAEKRTALN